MKFCNKCGAQLADEARFCPKCGKALGAAPISAGANTDSAEPPAAVAEPTKKERTTSYPDMFKKWFWFLYVACGLCSVLLVDLGFKFLWSGAKGFMIFCGVFAIIAALAFLAVGIINKVLASRAEADEKLKNATRVNVCLAVSCIVFVYVLIGAIAIFAIF